jgi:hypothetical protein
MKEKDIINWHLIDLLGETVSTIATATNYKTGYIDNIRTGRKVITDKFRFRIAKAYPSLSEFMLQGEPPQLPESKALLVRIWHVSGGDDLETIAAKTGYKVGYLRRIFNGSVKISDAFLARARETYPALVKPKFS